MFIVWVNEIKIVACFMKWSQCCCLSWWFSKTTSGSSIWYKFLACCCNHLQMAFNTQIQIVFFVWPSTIFFPSLQEKLTFAQILPEDLLTWDPCCWCSWSSLPSSPTRKAWKAWVCWSQSPTRTSSPQGLASPGQPSHYFFCSVSLFWKRQALFHLPSHQLLAWGVFDPPPSLGSSRSAGQGGTAAATASCHTEQDSSADTRWKAHEEEKEEEEEGGIRKKFFRRN